MERVNLGVRIGNIAFKNPVLTASGTCGYGEELREYMDLNRLGGIVTKGISLEPRAGNPPPRIIETHGGMLNAIGLENVGAEAFLEEKLPFLRECGAAVIVNVLGRTVDEYVRISERIGNAEGVDAIELNVSCPNVSEGGIAFGSDPEMIRELTVSVKKVCRADVWVKLSPNVTSIGDAARGAEDGGADAVSAVNTYLGMAIDAKTRKPVLANVTGGLSGAAIKPMALYAVFEITKRVKIPVIGIGGIFTLEDLLEFVVTGASAVQVGTATFIEPSRPEKLVEGLEGYLREEGGGDFGSLIGSLNLGD